MKEVELCNYLKEKQLLSEDLLITFYDNTAKYVGALFGETKHKWYLSVYEDMLCVYQLNNFFKFGGVKEETIKKMPLNEVSFKYSETGLLAKTKNFEISYNDTVVKGTVDAELVQNALKKIIEMKEIKS